jgi:hypothetical protein
MSSTIYKQYMKGRNREQPTAIKPVDDADAIAAWCDGVSFNKEGVETK